MWPGMTRAIVAIMSVVLTSFQSSAQPASPLLVTDDESYAVYAEVIRQPRAPSPFS
jgi:hypothetical protein